MQKVPTNASKNQFEVLNELQNCLLFFGDQKPVIEILRKGRMAAFDNEVVIYVFHQVLNTMGLNISVLNSNKRSDEKKAAIGLSIYFLKIIFTCNDRHICEKLPSIINYNLTEPAIRKYKGIISKVNLQKPRTAFDKIVTSHFDSLQNTFKKKLNNA